MATQIVSVATTCCWPTWNTQYMECGTVTQTVTNNAVWVFWNNIYVTGGHAVTQTVTAVADYNVWPWWNAQWAIGNYNTPAAKPLTAEEQARITADGIRRAEEHRVRMEELHTATEKALRLLKSLLDRQQLEQLEKQQAFELQVGENLYRIHHSGQRVERIDRQTKKVKSYFCIHPSHEHGLPGPDVAVAQKLFLEHDEKEFLRVANETRVA